MNYIYVYIHIYILCIDAACHGSACSRRVPANRLVLRCWSSSPSQDSSLYTRHTKSAILFFSTILLLPSNKVLTHIVPRGTFIQLVAQNSNRVSLVCKRSRTRLVNCKTKQYASLPYLASSFSKFCWLKLISQLYIL